jgi:DNA-3-methyladenine glycosylase
VAESEAAPDRPGEPLGRDFFARQTETVARELLGVWLVRTSDEGMTGGVIVETEAYGGPEDLASHSRAGRTRRTAPMFGPVGCAYVYLVYGMHHCLNVVAKGDAEAGAVLIRAVEPRLGIDLMRSRRGRRAEAAVRLAAGPARLCQAFAVTRELDGHDLTKGADLWLASPPPTNSLLAQVALGRRVGVDYAGDGWADRPWRFWISGSPSVSRLPRRADTIGQ